MKEAKKVGEIVVPIRLRMEFDPESRELLATASQAAEDIGEGMFMISDALGRLAFGDEARAQEKDDAPINTLAPCPFCGSPVRGQVLDEKDNTVWVACRKCGATGPRENDYGWATKRWNTRHGMADDRRG